MSTAHRRLACALACVLAPRALRGQTVSATTATLSPSAPSVPYLPPYISRPLLLPPGELAVHFGVGLAGSDITAGAGPGNLGLGLHAEAVLGLLSHIEIDGGVGLRVPGDGALLAADRYARVGMDDVFQTGNSVLGNPYVRVRVGLIDRPSTPIHLAIEGLTVVPVANATSWAFGLGAPAHFTLRTWLRIESGVFVLVLPRGTSELRNVVSVPVRINFAISDRVVAGLVTGLNAGNLARSDAYPVQIPFGVQGIFRIEPRTDLTFQWLFPTAAPQGVNAAGFGIGLIEQLL